MRERTGRGGIPRRAKREVAEGEVNPRVRPARSQSRSNDTRVEKTIEYAAPRPEGSPVGAPTGRRLGERARRDSRFAVIKPTRALGEASPDEARHDPRLAWLGFNVAEAPPRLRFGGTAQVPRCASHLNPIPQRKY